MRSLLAFLVAVLAALLVAAVSASHAFGQKPNYDEAKVPSFELPDPLRCDDGSRVETAAAWMEKRRAQILRLFESHVYGFAPPRPSKLEFRVVESGPALGGIALRKQVEIVCGYEGREFVAQLLLYQPAQQAAGGRAPVPVFLGMNFRGNHTVHADPKIRLPESWVPKPKGKKRADGDAHRARAAARGKAARRWPVADVLARGAALATLYCGDIDPDFDDGFENGLDQLFGEQRAGRGRAAWGSIAAWAWGLSRALDYFETDADIDAGRAIVLGHSRLGKAALWAGARDERFAMVVSNESGCGGAALSRRRFGESVARINTVFPHWFCARFHDFGGKEDELPVDQHMLAALCAPRPLLVCSAVGDRWADPRGEFLSLYHAGPVYRLFGADAPASDVLPEPGRLTKTRAGHWLRRGRHDMRATDWKAVLDFAAHHGLLQRVITAPPASMKLSPFYSKYLSAHGYPIVASATVSDYALREAAWIVDRMLAKRPDVRAAMIASGSRMIVMAHDEFTTDIPEYKRMRPKNYWDARARGLGGSRSDPVCSCAEENVLAYPGDPYSSECIVIHEFAHNIHLRGLVRVDETFDARLRKAYDAAMAKGLWKGKYASTNKNEYWAEGVQSWFGDNRENDHDHNHVNTREELREYDAGLAALCEEVFGTTHFVYTKPSMRLHGHLAGYEPKGAPRFAWPERLRKIKAKILEDAARRGK